MKLVSHILLSACMSILFSVATSAATPPADLNTSIQTTLDGYRTKYHLFGMELSVKLPGETTIHDFFSGFSNRDGDIPITKDTLFQIGSNTESFTAAILLQLEAEGKINLDDAIGKWFPTYADWKAVTVRQLLNHTSGIYDYLSLPTLISDMLNHPDRNDWSTEELVDMAYAQHPNTVFKPGKKWGYSSTDYALAGLIIQAVTGNSISDEMNKRLLTGSQLNLVNTFYLPYPKTAADRLAKGYTTDTSTDVSNINMSWAGPAGAIVSNSHDLALWIQELFKGKVLKPTQFAEMTSLVSIKNGQPLKNSYVMGYGLGIGAGTSKASFNKQYGIVYEQNGNTLGYRAYFMYLPCFDLIVTVATNNMSKKQDDINNTVEDVVKTVLKSGVWQTYKTSHTPDDLPAVCKKLWK